MISEADRRQDAIARLLRPADAALTKSDLGELERAIRDLPAAYEDAADRMIATDPIGAAHARRAARRLRQITTKLRALRGVGPLPRRYRR